MSYQRSRTLVVLFSLVLLLAVVACSSDAVETPGVVQDGAPATAQPSATVTAPSAATETAAPAEASAEAAAPPPAPTATPQPTVTPALVTVFYADGSETTMPPPPPTDFLELLEEQVEAGEWTESEGVIRLLRLLAGELTPEEVDAGVEVISHSATGLLRHAQDVAQDAETAPADRAEIERLLNRLTPSQEALELYSVPESERQSSAPDRPPLRFVRLQNQADACADLVADGYPLDEVTGFDCFVYRETEMNGFLYRVYYPYHWTDAEKQALVDITMQALTDSAETFARLGTVENVNIIFSPWHYEGDNRWAHQIAFAPGETCPITLFPSSRDPGDDEFMQTIAHEVFHCFQDWNFTTTPYAQHRWWIEGSAEYFSNVVYPTTNSEHRFLEGFDVASRLKSLMEMSYHNFIFFQYMANHIGDPALISLLETISAAGNTAAQARVLAAYGDMSGMFLDFVVSFMSEGIPDTGGGVIVIAHPAVTEMIQVSDEDEYEFEVRPFVAARFGLAYEQEKRFLQTTQPDPLGRHSMVDNRQRRDKAAWSDVPPEVRSFCTKEMIYALAVTTTETPHKLSINVDTVEVAACDPCMLGAWEVDHDSFSQYISRVVAGSGGGAMGSMQVTGGRDLIQFMEDDVVLTQRQAFQMTITSAQGPAIVSTTDSHGSGSYRADGEFLTVTNLEDVIDRSQMTVGGVPMAVELDSQTATVSAFGQSSTFDYPTDSDVQSAADIPYVCSEKTLTMTMDPYGDLLFHRVDELLPTPVPTPGAPAP